MIKELSIDDVLKLDKIQKISKIGSVFYIPANSTEVFSITKGNGIFQEIMTDNIFDKDIFISIDDIRSLIKQVKNKDFSNLHYNDLYYEYHNLFTNIHFTINQYINTDQLYHEDNFEKSNQFQELYKMKADDGSMVLTFNDNYIILSKSLLPATKSNSISLNIFHFMNNKKLFRFFIYKTSSDILIENFVTL